MSNTFLVLTARVNSLIGSNLVEPRSETSGKERSDWQRICKICVASAAHPRVLALKHPGISTHRRCVGFNVMMNDEVRITNF